MGDKDKGKERIVWLIQIAQDLTQSDICNLQGGYIHSYEASSFFYNIQ